MNMNGQGNQPTAAGIQANQRAAQSNYQLADSRYGSAMSRGQPPINFPPDISPILNNTKFSAALVDQSYIQNQKGALSLNVSGAPDPRKNDNNYACLLIKRMEFFCSKVNLEKHSNYLFRVFERQEQSLVDATRNAQIRIKLPNNTKPDVLIMFVDHIDRGKEWPDKIDLYIAQNVVTIAEALKMRHLQKKFLMEIIMPMLNRENVIFFVKMAYKKLSDARDDDDPNDQDEEKDVELESVNTQKEEETFWLEFLSYTLDLAAANIQYILKKKSVELHGVLEASVIDEIIERAIKFYRADLTYDSSALFETLMKIRGCDSIFQLLEQERQKILETEETILKSGVKPTLTWKVQNLSGNFYRESDGFWVENAQWKLAISYFSNEEDSLSVQLKMITNPFDVKGGSKDYFKKKDYFLPSNVIGLYNANPIDDYEEYDLRDQEEINARRKQIEKANAEYPTHSYISIVSAVRISQNEELKDPHIHTIICSSKAPANLKKIEGFYPEDYDGEVTIEIYFKLRYIYSALLHYITRNFTHLITDPSISLLPKDQFKVLLKHKFLSVTQEDEVVKALCLWLQGQDPTENLRLDLAELLENVQWNYVSTACLLDLMRNFAGIRRNDAFKKILIEEFQLRLKFKPDTTKLQPPRFCYKFNKTQTNPDAVSKNSKNAKALLFINHEDFFQKLVEQMLEPIDLIRPHLISEGAAGGGVSENAHRKFLEIQMLQKQKELQEIQQQLNNMNLLDEMGDQSRSNSRVNRSRMTQNHRSSYADDQETVKNSMINLLNVMDGPQQKQPQTRNSQPFSYNPNPVNASNLGEHLRNASQEFVKKMNMNINNASSPFEAYQNHQEPGKANKVKIFYQTQSDDEDNEQEVDQSLIKTAKQDVHSMIPGQQQQQNHIPNAAEIGAQFNQGYEDDVEDRNLDDDDEEEKEVFNAANVKTLPGGHQDSIKTDSRQNQNIVLTTEGQLVRQLNGGTGKIAQQNIVPPLQLNRLQNNYQPHMPDLTHNMSQELNNFQPDQTNQEFNRKNQRKQDEDQDQEEEELQSFDSNSIVVGGGNIVSSQNLNRNSQANKLQQPQPVIVTEHREIQTSINLILTARASKRNYQEDTNRLVQQQSLKQRQRGIDQSVQLTLPSHRGVAVGISLGIGQSEFEQALSKKVYSDACTQFEESECPLLIPTVSNNQSNKTLLRSLEELDRQLTRQQPSQGIDRDERNDTQQSYTDLQQSQVLESGQRERPDEGNFYLQENHEGSRDQRAAGPEELKQSRLQSTTSPNGLADIEAEVAERYMTQNLFSQRFQEESREKGVLGKIKLQGGTLDKRTMNEQENYVRGMHDYAQFIQQHSKDAFDNNFMEQFLGSANPLINSSFPIAGLEQRTYETIALSKLDAERLARVNKSSSKNAHYLSPTSVAQVSTNANTNNQSHINQSELSQSFQQSVGNNTTKFSAKLQGIKSPKNSSSLAQSNISSFKIQNSSKVRGQSSSQNKVHANFNNHVETQINHQPALTQNTNESKTQLNDSYVNLQKANQRARSQNIVRGFNKNVASKKSFGSNNLNQSAIESTAAGSSNNMVRSVQRISNATTASGVTQSNQQRNQSLVPNPKTQANTNASSNQQRQIQSATKSSKNQTVYQSVLHSGRTGGQPYIPNVGNNKILSIPTSTKNNKNILSVQRLLEQTTQSVNLASSNINNQKNVIDWNQTQEMNFSSPVQNLQPLTAQQLLNSQLTSNQISLDLQKLAAFNILDQLQSQSQLNSLSNTQLNPLLGLGQMPYFQNTQPLLLNQGWLSYCQSPSAQMQLGTGLNMQNLQGHGSLQGQSAIQNKIAAGTLMTIEEVKSSEQIASLADYNLLEDQKALNGVGPKVQGGSSKQLKMYLNNGGGSNNSKNDFQGRGNMSNMASQNLLTSMISPQSNTVSGVNIHNINLNLLNAIKNSQNQTLASTQYTSLGNQIGTLPLKAQGQFQEQKQLQQQQHIQNSGLIPPQANTDIHNERGGQGSQ